MLSFNEVMKDCGMKSMPKVGDGQSESRRENNQFTDNNCLVALLAPQNFNVGENDFEGRFGKEAADFLKQIGCSQVGVNGNSISLTLKADYTLPVNQGINGVRFRRNVSLNVTRQNDGSIAIRNVNGVDIDAGSLVPWISAPNCNIRNNSIEIITPVKDIRVDADPSLHESVSKILESTGR